jgi:EmrB/QacA subfamily drug resistance transporter
MVDRDKLVPLVVALPVFLQNLDTAIMGTALPAMAQSLHVNTLRLNLAITAYLISLAIFMPASGWIAERFGPRRVFCSAIALFSIASALCGMATSLEMLVACRILQGLGGAMMVPVGRLILLRVVAPGDMISAMIWFSVPPTVGRMLGPLAGGMAVTWLSWRWIFLVNVPLGILGIVLALWLLDASDPPQDAPAFDVLGFLLLGIGLASSLAALEGAASHLVEPSTSIALAFFGIACLVGYGFHSRRLATPLIQLSIIRHPTFFASVVGGFPLRLAIGAVPFMLPLLLQIGFGLPALVSGLLTMGTAVGALATRMVLQRAIGKLGFRPLLLGATVSLSVCYGTYAGFTQNTPHELLFAAFVAGGLLMSIVMTALQPLTFAEVPDPLMSQATALWTMAQQLSFSFGVLLAVELLRTSVWWRHGNPSELSANDFPPAFIFIAATVLIALFFFIRLPINTGAEFAKPKPTRSTDGDHTSSPSSPSR